MVNELKNLNVASAYEHSFGNLADNTVYMNPYADVDLRSNIREVALKGFERLNGVQLKELSIGGMGAGTAGVSLIPVYVDNRIIDLSRKFTPWTTLIPRVTNMGITADYNRITAKGAAITAAEDAPLADVTDTESRASTRMKYLYSVGRVTGPAQASMPSYIISGLDVTGSGLANTSFGSPTAPNAKQYEVLKRARALQEKEESLIWSGDASTTPTEFSGIPKLQDGVNEIDKTNKALDWADIEDAVELAFEDSGRPNIAGCDSSTLADIRKIMIDNFRYTPGSMRGTVGFGVEAPVVIETMVGPVPIVPSQYLANTTGNKSIYFLDTSTIEMRVLQDTTYVDMGITADSQKFFLKKYEALINKAPQFSSYIKAIK